MTVAAALTNPNPPSLWMECLPSARRGRLSPALPPEKRSAILSAYALAYALVRNVYGEALWRDLAYTEQGKPYFPARPDCHISLSHTSGYVLCALTDKPVGCDVEMLRGVGEALGRKLLGNSFYKEDKRAFFRNFCAKEASYKQRGRSFWDDSSKHTIFWIPGACACVSAEDPPDYLPLYDEYGAHLITTYRREEVL